MKDYYSKIAIIGLGYVGLPIAIAFAKKNVKVIGYDLDKQKINNLLGLKDTNNILHQSEKKYLKKIFFTNKISDIQISSFINNKCCFIFVFYCIYFLNANNNF